MKHAEQTVKGKAIKDSIGIMAGWILKLADPPGNSRCTAHISQSMSSQCSASLTSLLKE
jgi:hypothetical protein